MRRIRNVAFAFMVLASMVRFGGTSVRADYYFYGCESVYPFGNGVDAEHCDSSCYSLGFDCNSYCGGGTIACSAWIESCEEVSYFDCYSWQGWSEVVHCGCS